MKLSRFISIVRGLDFRYASNRAILALFAGVALVGAIYQGLVGLGWLSAAWWGLRSGLTVFLTWAICRELDPDHPEAALAAAGLALVGLALDPQVSLLALFWLLAVIRIANRTTGQPATALDAIGALGLSGWLAWQDQWGYLALAAVAFLLDGLLPDPRLRQLVFAVLSVALSLSLASLPGAGQPSTASFPALGMALLLSILLLPLIREAREVESRGDRSNEPLVPLRVQAGQALALMAGIWFAGWNGWAGFLGWLPLWAAVLGASVWWFYRRLAAKDTPTG